MLNIKLVVAYDGKAYLGWQKTHIGKSIENALQKSIEQILQHSVVLQAASRTDRGVHAEGQVVNFFTPKMNLDLSKFQMSLIRLLPKDITILKTQQMPLSFHPTLDCLSKEYHYYMCLGPTQLPYHRFYSWHIPSFLDLSAMQHSVSFLIGKHDFTSFCNVRSDGYYQDYRREVQFIEIRELHPHRLMIRIQGRHFLYKMVRNIVGTLVSIGRGKIQSENLPLLLEAKSRPQMGMTAPAHGLFLYEIFYRE